MANTESAKKRARANLKRTLRNKSARSAIKTHVTKVRRAVDEKAEGVSALLVAAISSLDRAAVKGIVHPNNAARRKSRLMQRVARADLAVTVAPATAAKAKSSGKATTGKVTAKKR